MLDVLERERGGASERVASRVPERLREHATLSTLRASSPTDTIPLADGEEVLLAIDATLGDGSGKVLEVVMFELATRVLSQGSAVVLGDLLGTVARLRTALERPFVGIDVLFELRKNDTGFSLTIGIPGQPRSARILRHLATGAIRAAQRFSREATSSEFRLLGETLGDRAVIDARYRHQPEPVPEIPEASPFTRRPSRSLRATQPTLSDEVERILSQRRPVADINPVSTRSDRESDPPPLRRPSGPMQRVKVSSDPEITDGEPGSLDEEPPSG